MADISIEALQRYCYCIDAMSNYLSSVDTVVNDLMYIKSPALRGKAIEMFNESMKTVKAKLQYLSNEMHSHTYKHPVEDNVTAPSLKYDSLAECNSLTECNSLADEYAAVQKLMRSSFRDCLPADLSHNGNMKKQAELESKATSIIKKNDKQYRDAYNKTFPKVLQMIKEHRAFNLKPETPGYAIPTATEFSDKEIKAVKLSKDEKLPDSELHSYLSALDKVNNNTSAYIGASAAAEPACSLKELDNYTNEMNKIASTKNSSKKPAKKKPSKAKGKGKNAKSKSKSKENT